MSSWIQAPDGCRVQLGCQALSQVARFQLQGLVRRFQLLLLGARSNVRLSHGIQLQKQARSLHKQAPSEPRAFMSMRISAQTQAICGMMCTSA